MSHTVSSSTGLVLVRLQVWVRRLDAATLEKNQVGAAGVDKDLVLPGLFRAYGYRSKNLVT